MSDEAVESNSIETGNNNSEAESVESSGCSVNKGTPESDLAKGLSSIISSVITDFDSRAQQTILSQHQLSSSIDRLALELDQLLEDAPLPFMMQHAAKISGVRKRVSSLNLVLKSVQRRLDNIDRTLSAGLSHEKTTTGNSEHH
ncbi:uncharacterized protein LOC141724322 [Apium graveolens]|uniref:uncharacterized protein LOC141724322 n=1 Tax=Apium graveolens TaxID=4045 RepID=UPI003D79E1FB